MKLPRATEEYTARSSEYIVTIDGTNYRIVRDPYLTNRAGKASYEAIAIINGAIPMLWGASRLMPFGGISPMMPVSRLSPKLTST